MDNELNLVPCDDTIDNDIAKERIIKSIGDFIDKLILLEEELGTTIAKEFLDPKSLNFKNASDKNVIESVANKIAAYLNLPNEIKVNIVELPMGVGGNVSPSYDNTITINIDKYSTKMENAVLGVLAHELTHQYLFIHDIDLRHISTLDNELLTDIAAIYIGLGNLILNGHRNEKKEYYEQREITYKMKLGYVKTHYLGFVYKTICNMRNIPDYVYNEQLSSQSKIYIAQAMNHNEFSPYLKQNFFNMDNANKTVTTISEVFYSIQVLLADIEHLFKNDDILFAKEIKPFLVESHQKLFKYFNTFSNFTFKDTSNSLRFLYNMKAYQTLDEVLVCFDTTYNTAKSYLSLPKNIDTTQNSELKSEPETCYIICRNDGTKIEQTTGKPLFIVKCPKCGYQFLSSTDNALHQDEIMDFESLYREHFVQTEPEPQIIVDQGLIRPIFSLLKARAFLSLALLFIIIGIIILILSHIYFALFFWALALVFVIIDVFNLADIDNYYSQL